MKKKVSLASIIVIVVGVIGVYFGDGYFGYGLVDESDKVQYVEDILNVPEYNGSQKYVIINNNEPFFQEEDLVPNSYEFYSDLDSLNRCGVAMANIGCDLMPTEERGEIGSIKPSGWHTIKYDFISGKYLYNRCHIIAWKLGGLDSDKRNLMTGTRDFNIKGMKKFEDDVLSIVKIP